MSLSFPTLRYLTSSGTTTIPAGETWVIHTLKYDGALEVTINGVLLADNYFSGYLVGINYQIKTGFNSKLICETYGRQ